MITITLQQIKSAHPCEDGWKKVLKANGGTKADFGKPFPLSSILESNDLDDTLWTLQCLPEYHWLWRKFAVWGARKVQNLMEDQRSIDALDVAWRHADGLATDEELSAAWAAAWDAAWAAARAAACDAAWAAARAAARDAAWAAARDAARDAALAAARAAACDAASDAASDAACDAACDAAWDAARDAAWAAAWDAARDAACDAARDAAWAAARDAARDAQAKKLKQILDAGEWIDSDPE